MMVREASRRFVRSLSPSDKEKSSKGDVTKEKTSLSRSRSDDLDNLAAAMGRKGRRLPQGAFDWSAMAEDSAKKDKTDKSKKKKKYKEKEKSPKKAAKRDSAMDGTEGVFGFAYEK
jgi:hypothetical protein